MKREQIKKLIYNQQTRLAPSKIFGAGVGVFALVNIPKDTLILGCRDFKKFIKETEEYLFDWSEFDDLDERIKKYLRGMTDGYNNKFYIDAPPFMLYQGYYINHSSTPNCFWDRRTSDIFSQVDIMEGDELTMYYMTSERDF
jgi:SET domain-containing protein